MDRIHEAVSRAKETRSEPARRRETPSIEPRHTVVSSDDAASSMVDLLQLGIPEFVCDRGAIGRHRIIANEQDPALNAYRVLRTRTLQQMERNGWRTIAVASAASGAGKTVTAINLAVAIGSKEGSRATIVDLDFYRPSVASYLGVERPPSGLDFFENKKGLAEVTFKIDFANVLVVANERVTRRGAELLTSPKVDELISIATQQFRSRIVVFDISPVLGCDDAIAFLPKVDCVLFVAASGQTRTSELKEARRLLKDANVIGTVLNKAPEAMAASPYY